MDTVAKCVEKAPKEYRHIRLYGEVIGMSAIIVRLNALKDRLNGAPPGPNEATKQEQPCFMVVLSEGPDILVKIREECMGLIDEIEGMLF